MHIRIIHTHTSLTHTCISSHATIILS